jgi:hypothetical protein
MDNTGRKLKKLFDFQRFEKDPGLQSVIDGVTQKKSGVNKLSDDDLEFVAGGAGKSTIPDDPQNFASCKATKDCCGKLMPLSTGGYICSDCKQLYDANMKPVTKSTMTGNGINWKLT